MNRPMIVQALEMGLELQAAEETAATCKALAQGPSHGGALIITAKGGGKKTISAGCWLVVCEQPSQGHSVQNSCYEEEKAFGVSHGFNFFPLQTGRAPFPQGLFVDWRMAH